MILDQAAAILGRLCVCGPLLYIGLLMAIDPVSIVRLSERLARGLRNIEHGMREFPLMEQFREPAEATISEAWRIASRLIGLALAACAILFLAAAT
ncbi:MAG: hypothetical protein ABSG65_10410 [Bryobacteraceae bacterium]|jgi:hypothetical protein